MKKRQIVFLLFLLLVLLIPSSPVEAKCFSMEESIYELKANSSSTQDSIINDNINCR